MDVSSVVIFALIITVPISALVWLINTFIWTRRYNELQKLAHDEIERITAYYTGRS
ncbi:hypothetical protein SEA_FEDE_29 [Microbacterium phage Fede]|nr:hypothetical protein SEA_FEDE_29 [Microbacterium phage Fede]